MTEENKDLQGTDPNAEGSAEEQATTHEKEHTEAAAADEPVTIVNEDEANAVIMADEADKPAAASKGTAAAPAAEANGSSRRGGSQVWIGVSLLLAVLLVISLFKSPFAQKDADKAVASVNGEKITKQELYDALVEAGGTQTLSSLIDEELIRQEADKAKVEVTDADIKKERDFYITQFGSEEALSQLLAQYGMTDDDFQKELKKEAQMRKLLEPKVTVTDDQISDYFTQNKSTFDTPAQVRASQIVVATEAEAKDIVKELQGGSDFAELAKSKSTDEATKTNGGDVGFITQNSGLVDTAVETEALKLKKDEISTPVKTAEGTYAVIKVTDTKEAHTATLEEKKADIKDLLVTQQISSMSSSWLDEIRSSAKITNTLEDKASDEAAAEDAAATSADTSANASANTGE